MHIQGAQGSRWSAAVAVDPSAGNGAVHTAHMTHTLGGGGATGDTAGGGERTTPLRVDAQRNLEHVLRAAREVFGESGYGAPMEDVARRARVGVGTVYRRFPSKEVLVRRIAEEETARLTEQARAALGQEEEPWSALSRFLRTSVALGAGRLLPPRILRVGPFADAGAGVGEGADHGRAGVPRDVGYKPAGLRLVDQPSAPSAPEGGADGSGREGVEDDAGATALLDLVGRLVERARTAGELRSDVTVSDVLLVIATAAPSLPDAAQQAAASERLLDILLEGLRSRPGESGGAGQDGSAERVGRSGG